MQKIFCPKMAIVENADVTISQICTIYTNDESIVTLIDPKPYPKIGEQIVKDSYYLKEEEVVKATKTELITDKTVTIKIASEKIISDIKSK
jgi:hypothetical protein